MSEALYCGTFSSCAQIISKTIAVSIISPAGRYLGESLENGSMPYPQHFCYNIFVSNF